MAGNSNDNSFCLTDIQVTSASVSALKGVRSTGLPFHGSAAIVLGEGLAPQCPCGESPGSCILGTSEP